MQQGRKMRPTYRPKHERRTLKKSGARPHVNYTSRERAKQPTRRGFTEQPPNRFYMPPESKEPSHAKIIAQVTAFVLGGFALMYAITWIYGHFRWGW